jgi:hypothetical protein
VIRIGDASVFAFCRESNPQYITALRKSRNISHVLNSQYITDLRKSRNLRFTVFEFQNHRNTVRNTVTAFPVRIYANAEINKSCNFQHILHGRRFDFGDKKFSSSCKQPKPAEVPPPSSVVTCEKSAISWLTLKSYPSCYRPERPRLCKLPLMLKF